MLSTFRLMPALLAFLPSLALAQGAPLSLQPGAPAPALPPVRAPAAAAPAAGQPAPVQPGELQPESPQATIQRVNAYFNGLATFSSRFVQVGADGRRFEGTLYVARPGKMRFEYDPPSPLVIVADGTSVVIRDKKLATQDLYAIGQTPLKFLLSSHLDVSKDAKILELRRDLQARSVMVYLEDKTTFGGTSRIRLVLGDEPMTLRQWTITDPQGFNTQVALTGIDTSKKLASKLFEIDYARAPERQN